MRARKSGVLLHITSLPGPFGIGDFGVSAYRFADFLHQAGQHYWQTLPMTATSPKAGNSPYSSPSAFALNPLLVSPELLYDDGLLTEKELKRYSQPEASRVDYQQAARVKDAILEKAFKRFQTKGRQPKQYRRFIAENAFWLDDFSLFMVLKQHHRTGNWSRWPIQFRNRHVNALAKFADEHAEKINYHRFVQYILFEQWQLLRRYCRQKKIKLFGDMPIYVQYNSADVWANPKLFKLDRQLKPTFVAGTPPDFFSKTGQRWGNPVYNWRAMQKTGYSWWIKRFEYNLNLYDLLRVDHFRGFVKYWEIPARNRTAIKGKWTAVPVYDFFDTIFSNVKKSNIIAEDLGDITDDVIEVMKHYRLPGMRILQFAFGDENPDCIHLPHNYKNNCVAYTATHDNNTLKGWYHSDISPYQKQLVKTYLATRLQAKHPHSTTYWQLIEQLYRSNAFLAVVPMQDLLELDSEARMNVPGVPKDNWQWRLTSNQLTDTLSQKIKHITQQADRW